MAFLTRDEKTRRKFVRFKLTVGCIAAVVLPWFATNLSIRTPDLRGTPLAVSFACVAGITIFSGLVPGILASISTALIFNYYGLAPTHRWSLDQGNLIRTAVILTIGLLVNAFFHRQYIIGERLRKAHAALQSQTDSLMEAQKGSNSAAWAFSVLDRRTYWAEGGARIFGRPFSEVSLLNAMVRAILEEDRARFLQTVERAIRTGEDFHVEFRVRWHSGELHWLESRGAPSRTNSEIWRGVTIDVTDRKNAEIAVIRSEKLAAIGRLSATIAHEINNPLEAVTNLLYLASSDPSLPSQVKSYLNDADRELARLANIARRTLTFVRTKSSSLPANLAEVTENVVAMFKPRCSSRDADLRFNGELDLKVAVPSDDLWQILTNIISNACDALPEREGAIEIHTAREKKRAAIYIRDNGTGIAQQDINRIFDPFFTTKEGVGTGIGLWVTKDLVERNGGRISVRSDDLSTEFRTTFRVEFPLA